MRSSSSHETIPKPRRPLKSGRLCACFVALGTTALLLGGCGGSSEGEPASPAGPDIASPGVGPDAKKNDRKETVTPSHCPAGLPDCLSAEGRIVYVERVDPDGDGDAHFVLADSQSITLPGLTVIDVREGLRPVPLPGPGELISAAGPVQTGSYGQSQIHAIELHVAGE